MTVWQADFYRRPLQDQAGNPLWELVVCDQGGQPIGTAVCVQSEANSGWLTQQLQQFVAQRSQPDRVQVFRPQAVSLLHTACVPLQIAVEPTRHTPALKQLLQQKAASISCAMIFSITSWEGAVTRI